MVMTKYVEIFLQNGKGTDSVQWKARTGCALWNATLRDRTSSYRKRDRYATG